jgi:ComF family protein
LRSAFRYEGEVRRLVHALKFDGQSAIAEDLTLALAPLAEALLPIDVIVPVPLTGSRRRQRGFNQAALIAKQIAHAGALRFAEPLERVRSSPPQARSATAEDRWRNVEGAFALRRGADVRGLNVVVVDDVATTGATLDACARVLIDGSAASVSGLTFARED